MYGILPSVQETEEMTSTPTVQIAYALLDGNEPNKAERDQHAQELAQLLDDKEICPACWRLASNGTAGRTEHNHEMLCIWG